VDHRDDAVEESGAFADLVEVDPAPGEGDAQGDEGLAGFADRAAEGQSLIASAASVAFAEGGAGVGEGVAKLIAELAVLGADLPDGSSETNDRLERELEGLEAEAESGREGVAAGGFVAVHAPTRRSLRDDGPSEDEPEVRPLARKVRRLPGWTATNPPAAAPVTGAAHIALARSLPANPAESEQRARAGRGLKQVAEAEARA